MNQKALIPVVGVLLLFAAYFAYGFFMRDEATPTIPQTTSRPTAAQSPSPYTTEVTVGTTNSLVEVADTDPKRELGLSHRDTMPKEAGMLFTFDTKIQPSFWMRGMRFALDFIWIADGKVVEVMENVPAHVEGDQYKYYTPKQPVDGVIEVNAGFVKEKGVAIGDMVNR